MIIYIGLHFNFFFNFQEIEDNHLVNEVKTTNLNEVSQED